MRYRPHSGDINIPHYIASNRTWVGEQRKCSHYNITDSISSTDHVEKAILYPFRLAGEIPLPSDESRDMDFIPSTPGRRIRKIRMAQFPRLKSLVKGWADTQLSWDKCRPQSAADGQSPVRTVPIAQLLAQLGLGGGRNNLFTASTPWEGCLKREPPVGSKSEGSGRYFHNIRNLSALIRNKGEERRVQIRGYSWEGGLKSG